MPRRREANLLDLALPLAALFTLGFFFVPAFRRSLGTLFVIVVSLGILAVAGLLVRAIVRHKRKPVAQPGTPEPPRLTSEQMQAYREAFGRPSVYADDPPVPPTEWTRELLSILEWKRFEELVAAYSRELGYKTVTARTGADGGVDVQLFQDGQAAPVMIVQCKAWDAYKVGVKPVRELYGVMAADKVANGAFFTTGEFTLEAEKWARDKNLDLVDGRELLNRIRQLAPAQQKQLLELATRGDFTTPTCPSCGVKMVERTAGKGANAGSQFWGCPNFPRCRQTFRIARSD